jgi:5'-nucleotidase
MRILLTNDDGVSAAGIKALALALCDKHTVIIAAPSQQKSGASHSFTCSEYGLSAERVSIEGLEHIETYAVDGTPADCTKLGMQLMGEWPDMVISGINHGNNLGTDTLYSGTVGAAMEATVYGISAIAVSDQVFEPTNFDACIYALEEAMRMMEKHKELMLLNVNAPDCAREECKGIKLTPLGYHRYPTEYELRKNENGKKMFYSHHGIVYMSQEDDDVDDRWVQKGYATITPMQMSFTDERMLEILKKDR